jgi:hypothetical protein
MSGVPAEMSTARWKVAGKYNAIFPNGWILDSSHGASFTSTTSTTTTETTTETIYASIHRIIPKRRISPDNIIIRGKRSGTTKAGDARIVSHVTKPATIWCFGSAIRERTA